MLYVKTIKCFHKHRNESQTYTMFNWGFIQKPAGEFIPTPKIDLSKIIRIKGNT